jgi:hypothetical protein
MSQVIPVPIACQLGKEVVVVVKDRCATWIESVNVIGGVATDSVGADC